MVKQTSDLESRRIDLAREPAFRLGALDVRPGSRELIGPNGREALEPRVMQVLVALARARGEIVTRGDLIEACWEGRAVSEDAVNRVIAMLRRLSEDAARDAFTLETINKVGYRLLAAPGAEPPPRAAGLAVNAAAWLRARAVGAAVAFTIVVIGASFWAWTRLSPSAPTSPPAIAVAPFDVLDDDVDARAFAEAIANQIVGVMSLNDLNAVAHSEAETLSGPGRMQAAERMGAAFLLTGVVRRTGGEMSVSVHIEDVRARRTLWSKDYERRAAEAALLEQEVALNVTDVLRCALVTLASGGVDPQTLQLFLHACEVSRASWHNGEDVRAIARQITERAPRLSRGWSMLARASIGAATVAPDARAAALTDEARNAAERALQLDPHNEQAYVALSYTIPRRDWAGRRRLLEQALAAAPDSPEAIAFRGRFLLETGRLNDALESYRRAAVLDPLSPGIAAAAIFPLMALGRTSEAQAAIRRFNPKWPNSQDTRAFAFLVSVYQGPPEEAIRLLAEAERMPPDFFRSHASSVTFTPVEGAARRDFVEVRRTGRGAAAAGARIRELALARQFNLIEAMRALAQLDQRDAAFEIADTVYASERAPTESLFFASAKPMRHDRRFMALAKRLGLADYWLSANEWPDFCADPGLPYDCRTEARTAPH